MDMDLGRPRHWPGIPWAGAGGRKRKKRRASGVAARAKNAPQHCKTGLSHCMKGGGRGKAGTCMKGYWRCIKGGR